MSVIICLMVGNVNWKSRLSFDRETDEYCTSFYRF